MAQAWNVSRQSLVLTNGVDEAIDMVTSLVRRVWCLVPGFDAFWARPEMHGRLVTRIPLEATGQPAVSAAEIGPEGAAFLARPNNPTGTVIDTAWMEALPQRLDYVCVDETYIDFATHTEGFLHRVGEWPNLCVFRSLSKGLGLASLRIGALVAPPALAARLRERQRFYPIDTIALDVAAAAITDEDYGARHRAYVRHQRVELLQLLRTSGWFVEVHDTHANFLIGRCADAATAIQLEQQLAHHEVYVQECSPFGYPGRLRISIGPPEEVEQLHQALKELSRDTSST